MRTGAWAGWQDFPIQRQVLYLGEIASGQQAVEHERFSEAFDEGTGRMAQIALFPEDSAVPEALPEAVQVRLKDFKLHRPRQWATCWLALNLLGTIAARRLLAGASGTSRKGTSWLKNVWKTLGCTG